MSLESMQDLLLEELRDLYNAEQQLTKALPKMIEKAASPTLRQAFQSHLRETENQVARLDQIFDHLDETPTGKTCKGMGPAGRLAVTTEPRRGEGRRPEAQSDRGAGSERPCADHRSGVERGTLTNSRP